MHFEESAEFGWVETTIIVRRIIHKFEEKFFVKKIREKLDIKANQKYKRPVLDLYNLNKQSKFTFDEIWNSHLYLIERIYVDESDSFRGNLFGKNFIKGVSTFRSIKEYLVEENIYIFTFKARVMDENSLFIMQLFNQILYRTLTDHLKWLYKHQDDFLLFDLISIDINFPEGSIESFEKYFQIHSGFRLSVQYTVDADHLMRKKGVFINKIPTLILQ